MPNDEKKGITVKIDAGLHAEVRQFLESHSMTMAEFVTLALQDELHPKRNITEGKNMGNMRTLAFQVPEELFQKIKDYLQRNNMTQKEFVIGLIETEIERDLTQRTAVGKGQTESAAVSDCDDESEEIKEETDERESADCEDDFDDENEELDDEESEDIDKEQDESEDQSRGESDDESDELDDKESEDIDEEQDESEASVMSMSM